MTDVTRILSKIKAGDPQASAELLPLVYDELRRLAQARMAGERCDHTLQATALVHEAYLRLVDSEQVKEWDSKGHFFSAAAEAMRRILIESARRKSASKRGGNLQRAAEMPDIPQSAATGPEHLISVSEALDQLAVEEPLAAELVKLRVFAGFSIAESGRVLGVSRRKAYETWGFAEAWFSEWLGAADQ